MIRTQAFSFSRSAFFSRRSLHSSPAVAKTVTEKVSEVADKVNKGLGKGLADAIDKGESVTKATKESLGAANDIQSEASESAKQKMDDVSSQAGQKANQAASGVKKTKDEMKK